jgi:hypothetical protein
MGIDTEHCVTGMSTLAGKKMKVYLFFPFQGCKRISVVQSEIMSFNAFAASMGFEMGVQRYICNPFSVTTSRENILF